MKETQQLAETDHSPGMDVTTTTTDKEKTGTSLVRFACKCCNKNVSHLPKTTKCSDMGSRFLLIGKPGPLTFSERWTVFINTIRQPLVRAILAVADHAASHPRTHIGTVVFLSCGLLAAGIFTNFSVDVDEDVLWTPRGTRPLAHNEWIEDQSGFPLYPRNQAVLIHANGQNVVSIEGIQRAFTALDTLRNTTGFEELCRQSPLVDPDCDIVSVTQFWNHSVDIFQNTVRSHNDLMATLSRKTFPDGTPVDRITVFGLGHFVNNGTTLVSAKSFFMLVRLPQVDDAEAFESDTLDRLLHLKELWETEPNNVFRVETFAQRSFADEFTRAIVNDIPLVPAVFVVMSVFTCVVFFRRDWVYSRSLLGFGAVVCVLLSIMTGYGLLFLIGVPFTSMTQVSSAHAPPHHQYR